MATSDRTTTGSASGLHIMKNMKLFAVTMLAVLACSACGVGADEYYDGQNLVGSNGQALEQGTDVTPGPAVGPVIPGTETTPQTPITTAPSGVRDPSTVALPQDPIPVFEGKPVIPPSTPPFTGGVGPAPIR
ncbi:MAG: hypothetical protein QM817_02315 [Archangium sp.]